MTIAERRRRVWIGFALMALVVAAWACLAGGFGLGGSPITPILPLIPAFGFGVAEIFAIRRDLRLHGPDYVRPREPARWGLVAAGVVGVIILGCGAAVLVVQPSSF